MRMLAAPSLALSLAAALPVPATAQQPRDTGPAIAIPFFGTVTPGTPDPGGAGASGQRRLFARKAGFGAMSDIAPHLARPDFSYGAIFGSNVFRVDALSIGMDQLHTDCGGVIDLRGCSCWNMVLFSVEDGTGAATSSGVVAQEHAAVDGAGADVFCYVPITAQLVNSRFPGTMTRAIDSRELGFFRNGTTPAKGQINSLDMYAPLYELDDEIVAQLDPEPTVYFSVVGDPTDLAAVPSGWWFGTTPSGATILVRHWDSTVRRWVTLPPLYDHVALGLPAAADIDALAHNSTTNATVISLTRATTPPGLSQLLFVSTCPSATSSLVDLTESDGTASGTRRVADGTGVGGSGEVRGVCMDDPSVITAQPPAPPVGVMAHVMGTPGQDLVPTWTSLDAQTYRSCDAVGNVTYTAHLTGLPGAGPSSAVFLVGIPTLLPSPSVLFVIPARTIPPVAGDPQSASAILPTIPPVLSSVPLEGMWVGLNSVTLQIAITPPITMYL